MIAGSLLVLAFWLIRPDALLIDCPTSCGCGPTAPGRTRPSRTRIARRGPIRSWPRSPSGTPRPPASRRPRWSPWPARDSRGSKGW